MRGGDQLNLRIWILRWHLRIKKMSLEMSWFSEDDLIVWIHPLDAKIAFLMNKVFLQKRKYSDLALKLASSA